MPLLLGACTAGQEERYRALWSEKVVTRVGKQQQQPPPCTCVRNYLCTCDGEFHGTMSARQMREHVRSYFVRGEELARFEFSRKLAKTVNTLRWRTSCSVRIAPQELYIYIIHSYTLEKSLGFMATRAFKVLIKSR